MPLVAFALLAIVCLGLLGFACACLGDQAPQPLDRAGFVGSGLPPLVELWASLTTALGVAIVIVAGRGRARARASPALLQRFLF